MQVTELGGIVNCSARPSIRANPHGSVLAQRSIWPSVRLRFLKTMIPLFKSPFLSVCLALLMSTGVGHSAGPDYTRDIRPILAKRCMNCHGPDAAKRKADLRLDTKEGLLHPDVLIPGKSAESELIKRLLTSDPEEVMPPPGKGDPVTAEERQLLQAWIDAGAAYQGHWAFAAPVKPAVPVVAGARNEIDAFVFEAQAKQGMAPTTEASKEVWLRLSLKK